MIKSVRVVGERGRVGRDAVVIINQDTVHAFTPDLSFLYTFNVREEDAYRMKVSGLFLSADSCFYSLLTGKRYLYHLYFGNKDTAFIELFEGMGKCVEGESGLVVLEYLPFPPGKVMDACGRYLIVSKGYGRYVYKRCGGRMYPLNAQPFWEHCFLAPPYLYTFNRRLRLYTLDGRLLFSKEPVDVSIPGDSLVFAFYRLSEEESVYGVFILDEDSLSFCPYPYLYTGIIGTRGRNIYIFDGKELSLWHCSFFWEE
ncbi:hypothetical protein DRQ18_04385 [bacterium]|nr:MAG: hypothetical protein DRQ18_04385 [bacterium]